MSRRNLNRRRVLHGAGVGIAAGLAGCGGPGDDDDDDGTPGAGDTPTPTQDPANLPAVHHITDYWNSAWETVWNEHASAFESETGISVEVEQVGMSGEQESRLAQLIQAGDPPDANTSTFDQVANLWANDQLVPVNDVVDDIASNAGELLTEPFIPENGDIFQIPHGMYVSNFHYHSGVLDAFDLDPPETIDDVLTNARVIDESDMDMRGYGLAGGKVGKSQDEFQVYLGNMGVSGIGLRWKDPDARNELEIHFPEDKVTQLLQFFKDVAQYSPDPTSIGWGETFGRYLQGQFAQQYHLNAWPVGVAAAQSLASEGETAQALADLANATEVKALPTSSDIDKEENWQWEPAPDGYHILKNGTNTPGTKEWFRYLYADSMERTAGMYAQEPSRFLPTYADIASSDAYQNISLFSEFPHVLEELDASNQILDEHYGNVPESDLNSPVALYVTRQWFYGEMVNRVITDSMSVRDTYQWGLDRLETRFQEGQDQFN